VIADVTDQALRMALFVLDSHGGCTKDEYAEEVDAN